MEIQTVLGQKIVQRLEAGGLSSPDQEKLLHNFMIEAVQSGTSEEVKELFTIADSWQIFFNPSGMVEHLSLPGYPDLFEEEKLIFWQMLLDPILQPMMKVSGGPNIRRTFLHAAASLPSKDGTMKVKILLARGSDPSIIDENLWLPIDHAANIGNVDTVKTLIEANPKIVDYREFPRAYIIATGSELGESENILKILEIFQEIGADPNVIPSEDWGEELGDKNALMAAVEIGCPDRVEAILHNPKTNPNKRLWDGRSAMDLILHSLSGRLRDDSLKIKYREIALLIINHPKFDPNDQIEYRSHIPLYLHKAVSIGEVSVVNALIVKGANTTQVYEKQTPLQLVKLFLDNERDQNKRMNYEAIRTMLAKTG